MFSYIMDGDKLIELVHNYPYLYNVNDSKYLDSRKKDSAWREISVQLNVSEEICKKTWCNLRDAFRRTLKKRRDKKGSQPPNKIKKWRYEDQMSFMLPHFQLRDSNNTLSTSIPDVDSDSVDGVLTEDNDFIIPSSDVVVKSESETVDIEMENEISEETIRPNKTRKTSDVVYSETTVPVLSMKYMEPRNSSSVVENNQDDLDLFFLSMAATVRRFSAVNRATAKSKVCSLICELEIDDLQRTEMYTTI